MTYVPVPVLHAEIPVVEDSDEPSGALLTAPAAAAADMALFAAQGGIHAALTWSAAGALPGTTRALGMAWRAWDHSWLVVGNTDEAAESYDDGRTWAAAVTGMAGTVSLYDVACSEAGVAAAVGNGASIYVSDQADAWTTETAPNTPDELRSVKFDEDGGRFIAVGTNGTAAYIATGTTDGQTWTERTAPAGFASEPLGSLAVGGGIAVAASKSAHTKLAVSADGGLTWADSTTTLTSGIYQVTWNEVRETFYAIKTDGSSSTSKVYESEDGSTWTEVVAGIGVLNADIGGAYWHGFASFGSSIAVIGRHVNSGGTEIAVSADGGETWTTAPLTSNNSPSGLFSDGRLLFASYNNTSVLVSARRVGTS